MAQVTEYTAALQTDLQATGYYKGPVDGIYGPQTVAAVEQLQKDSGLPTTGLVDQATALALDKKLAAVGAQAATKSLTQTVRGADRAQADGLLDGAHRRNVDARAHRRAQAVPDRARRAALGEHRRGDLGRLRTGPRQAPDRGDDHHDRRTARDHGIQADHHDDHVRGREHQHHLRRPGRRPPDRARAPTSHWRPRRRREEGGAGQ